MENSSCESYYKKICSVLHKNSQNLARKMDLLSSIFLVVMLISLVVGIFIILCKFTNNRAKEIRGTPSVVASSSVQVNVYCDSHTKQIASARRGGGNAKVEIQRQIQDLKLWHSTFNKVPSVSNGDGSKVVHDGSKDGGFGGQRQIQNLNLTNSKKVLSANNRAKERRGTPSIVASSSVHVNVYGVPSVSTREDDNKVVHDGSKGGGFGGQRQIQDLNLTDSTLKAPSVSIGDQDGSANKCGHQKGYFVGVSMNRGGPGGDRANDNGGDSDDGVGNGAVGGVKC